MIFVRWSTIAVAAYLFLGAPGANAQTAFCWKETWGTGVAKSIPTTCPANHELNGAFCYENCRAGYTSNRIAGCIQNCPEGATDDGLFCGWPSYKAAEYPLWDKAVCERRHSGVGCEQIGLLWVERCKTGYKHILGFCEKRDIDCKALGLAGNRIANSCAKNTYGRAPKQAGCPSGQEFGAGLCYASCGANADRHGPLCWGKCPAGWVNCGMGCAQDANKCTAAIVDQVVSVVDSAISIALLVGTMGSSAATKSGQSLIQKGAWEGVKKIGKAQVKEILKNLAITYAVQLPGQVANSMIDDTVDYIWELEKIDTSTMTEIEKQHAIANLSLKTASLVDPSGIVGVVAAYTKPLCKDIMAARDLPVSTGGAGSAGAYGAALHGVAASGASGPEMVANEASMAAMDVSSKQQAIAATQDPGQKAALTAQLNKALADLALAQKRAAMANELANKSANWSKQFDGISSPRPTPAALQPGAATPPPAGASMKWEAIPGEAIDIALAADGTAWVIGSNAVAGGFGIWTLPPNSRQWQGVAGGAVRIAVAGQVPWVVNANGSVYEYRPSTRTWVTVTAPKAVDVGASEKAVWLIAEPKLGNNYTIYERTGGSWKQVQGAAVRIDVDSDGNPWVVNSVGEIYALVRGQWQRFASEPAADLGVQVFGAPWIVTKSGTIRSFNTATRQWQTHIDKGAAAVAGGASPWYVASDKKVFRGRN